MITAAIYNLQLSSFQDLALRNSDSPAALLMKFFQYYALEFDYLHDVVSVQHPTFDPNPVVNSSSIVKKIDKAEREGWIQHDRLRYHSLCTQSCNLLTIIIFNSIEDPFETWYDVAHVVKGSQMKYIRSEFLVSS